MKPDDNKIIWLVGEISQFSTVGLPTFGDVLLNYYYHRFANSKGKSRSFNDTANELIVIWSNLNKATVAQRDVVQRIKKLTKIYDSVKKSNHRRTPKQVDDYEKNFQLLLHKIFDISPKVNYHHNQHKLQNLVQLDHQSEDLNSITEEYNDMEVNNKSEIVQQGVLVPEVTESSFDDQSTALNFIKDEYNNMEVDSVNDEDDIDFASTLSVYYQSKFATQLSDENFSDEDVIYKIINSPDVSSALDRTNTSNGSFVIILAAIARALDVDLTECVFSTSTLLRRRTAHREVINIEVKNEFLASIKSGLVVHWDGKRLKNATAEENDDRIRKVERISIVVTGWDVQKIIAIAKADDGTGVVASETVFEHLDGWSITESIVAMCTDTTAANTGVNNGALVLFEEKMERNLIYLACRHHVFELIIGAVFQLLFGESTGRNVEMFEAFKRDWFKFEKSSFKPLSMNFFRKKYLKELRNDVISYIENILATKDKQFAPRGDYLEMMQLCLLVLGKPIPDYIFKTPQNCSHARWMGKCIYNLKIFLFREQVHLTSVELANLEQFCLFVCLIYTKSWIQCCVSSNAPLNDLVLLKSLNRYTKINADIANCAIEKFSGHLWYLGSELVILSLFSNNVDDDVKFRMFQKMKKLDDGQWIERNRALTFEKSIFQKELDDLVGPSSMTVLKSLKIDIDFMYQNDVIYWKQLEDYIKAKQIVDSFKVVNDTAERALKLMTDYNESLTRNECQMQKGIQVIDDNRKRVPNLKKSVLSSYTRRILPQ